MIHQNLRRVPAQNEIAMGLIHPPFAHVRKRKEQCGALNGYLLEKGIEPLDSTCTCAGFVA